MASTELPAQALWAAAWQDQPHTHLGCGSPPCQMLLIPGPFKSAMLSGGQRVCARLGQAGSRWVEDTPRLSCPQQPQPAR